MGVPGFIIWLRGFFKERMVMRKIDGKIKTLFIDGNCLVHPKCFDVVNNIKDINIPKDKLEHFMFIRICKFIDFLIDYTKPEQCYFAIDGVAPMAKINQQRYRRYKTTMENKMRDEIKLKHNKSVNNIWSNTVITPGTEFMKRLDIYLDKYFKDKRDNIKYIYSSYMEPGEGEHKILHYIKTMADDSQNNIIYGLDADLFFLCLTSGKNNLYLLREEHNILNGVIQKAEINDILNDVRENMTYISMDKAKECYNIKIKNIIRERIKISNSDNNSDFYDDFVFLCYLLGNDFLPHLPTIDIKKDGLDILIATYVDIYVLLKMKLIEKRENKITVNNVFLLELFRLLGEQEEMYYNEILPHYEYINSKKTCKSTDSYDKEIWKMENLVNIKKEIIVRYPGENKNNWKYRYYEHYYGIREHSLDFINLMCKMYIEGLKWVSEYYYNGCPDWRWHYPFSHAPYLSDIYTFMKNTNFDINKIVFIKGEALKPEIQLMAVLPRSCSSIIPLKYQKLLTDSNSPIIDLYPEEVQMDTVEKDMLWKCTVKLPYLDIDRIIEITDKIN